MWPPLVGTGKNYSYLVLQHIKKCYAKMSLVFLIIQKTSKWGCFWGGRNGMKQMYELKKLVTISELWISNFFWKSSFVSIISRSAVINKILKVAPKKKFGDPTLATPPGSPWLYNFLHKTYVMWKKTQLSIKNGTNNFEIKGGWVL